MNAPDRITLGLHPDMPADWRAIPGFDGTYSIDPTGRVRSEPRFVTYRGSATRGVPARIVKPTMASGYAYVRLWKDGLCERVAVHRLVLLVFVGAPKADGMVAAHNDGNPRNNCVANLRWATAKENMADRVEHGTANRGERHGMSKLTSADVLRIRDDQRTNREIAPEYGIHPATVSRIKRRADWGWL